jgi:tRNA A37 threonylcarbamoyladenosine synthetase subunit TsaC/SUA5/YrdC
MDKCSSTTRFSSIKVPIVLTQTDTTVGFLSHNEQKLYEIKSRQSSKSFIKVYQNFYTFLKNNRVPKKFKNEIRRSKKTTYIVKNRAFRVAKPILNSKILRDLSWCFSTSANESKKNFDREFCEDKADIIIQDINGLQEKTSSNLYKLSLRRKRKIR